MGVHLKTFVDKNGRECSKCGIYKNWNNYGKNANHSTGYKSSCIPCTKRKNPDENKYSYIIKNQAVIRRKSHGYIISISKKMWPDIASYVRLKLDKKHNLLELIPTIKSMHDTRKVDLLGNRVLIPMANLVLYNILPDLDIFLKESRIFIKIPDKIILDMLEKHIKGIRTNYTDLTIHKNKNITIRTDKWPVELNYFTVIWNKKSQILLIKPEIKSEIPEYYKYSTYKIRKIRGSKIRSAFSKYPDIIIGDYIYTGKNKDGSLKFRALDRAPMFDEFGNEL